MKRCLTAAVVCVMTLTVVSTVPALAENAPTANLQFRVTLTDIDADGKSHESVYELVTLDRTRTELLAGWRIPIPTTTFSTMSDKDSAKIPVTSYTYQNVGVTAQLEPRIVDDHLVRLKGQIEVSGFDPAATEKLATAAAKLGTFQHQFDAMLESGVALTVARAPKPDGGAMLVEIEIFEGE